MKLAIVMPAYNEASCIESEVRSWLKATAETEARVFVIDDGSRDQTGAILDRLAHQELRLSVIHQANLGHGLAVLRGYREAIASGHELIFQTDSDEQFLSEDFSKLWAEREKSPFILGFRKEREDPLHRRVVSQLVVIFNALVFGVWIKDPNVPYRLMRADFLSRLLELLPNRLFAPNIFLSILAEKSGARLLHIPVSHRARKSGTTSIVRWKLIRVCLRGLAELIVFRKNLFFQGARIKKLKASHGPG